MSDFWTDGVEGAVSLTYDDGAPTQLTTAIAMLDAAGLQGTFYVCPGRNDRYEGHLSEWQAASATGHEIGNHTCDHPCSCNFRFTGTWCLEKLGLADIADTIDRATAMLDEHFPEQNGIRSFCYPCYQSYVGSGTGRQSYVPLVAERFSVARGGGERANDPEVIDLAYVWARDVQGQTGDELIAFVEDAVKEHRWAILCMHGVGGDHLTVQTEELQKLVSHLAENRQRILTDTVIGVGETIIQRRSER